MLDNTVASTSTSYLSLRNKLDQYTTYRPPAASRHAMKHSRLALSIKAPKKFNAEYFMPMLHLSDM